MSLVVLKGSLSVLGARLLAKSYNGVLMCLDFYLFFLVQEEEKNPSSCLCG